MKKTPKQLLTERMQRDGHGSAQVGGARGVERVGVQSSDGHKTSIPDVWMCESLARHMDTHPKMCGTRTDDPRARRTSGHDFNNQECQNNSEAKQKSAKIVDHRGTNMQRPLKIERMVPTAVM
jgi:hypothetical protein